ncbi:MAG: beta-lactamase family protein [Oceanicaulis sp.]|uniref:serine hydrolase domain-containing protein n=1 Tax=Glycocaulis sp. TaxID=1969725 RepID=UPI0025B83132|nr:serine hydrolase domain-containing protein [Glycocaulis sp.]MCC5980838.1 beta-lactamase family protein [Oceanicaulis sp.]MCH8520575.1 beta-lactamase family protein [Glycocaulis sp.]
MRHTVFACAALTLAAASSAVPPNPHLRALTASAAAAYDDPNVTTTLSMAEADALLASLDAGWEADSDASADAGAEMALEAEAAPVRPESVLPGQPYRRTDEDEAVSDDDGEPVYVIGPPAGDETADMFADAPETDPEIQLAEAAAIAEFLDVAYVAEGVIAPEPVSGDSDDFVWRIAPERFLPGLIDEAETLAQLGDARQPRISRFSDLPYLDPVIERLNQAAGMRRTVGLAVAILEAGQPALIYTSGETAAGSGDPITPRTVFRAASLTKSITGVLLAHLEHEGRIRLDDPAPETIRVRSPRQPTVLDLVAHRTGLPRNAYDNRLEEGRAIDLILNDTAELNPVCAVGECYTYQNIVFSGAAEVVRRSTGTGYERNVRRRLYQRYGMNLAGFGERDLTSAASWARPHRGWQRTVSTPGSPASNYDAVAPAAAAVVSLEDLIAWVQAHISETGGIPQEIRERIFTPYVATPRETNSLNRRFPGRVQETHYGLGWRIYRWGERTLIAHSGYLSGYGAQIVMEPATGFAYIALWNADASAPWRLWPTVMDLRTGDGPGDWLDELNED